MASLRFPHDEMLRRRVVEFLKLPRVGLPPGDPTHREHYREARRTTPTVARVAATTEDTSGADGPPPRAAMAQGGAS